MVTMTKDWDQHVAAAEEVARGPGFQALGRRIAELAEPKASDVVLDVGAGTGLLVLALASRVSHVWALDISCGMMEYLRAKAASSGFDNVTTVVGSAVSLPLAEATIDVAVSNYCLHHLDEAGKLKALAEIHRVLKPGGRVVIGDMMFGLRVSDRRDREVLSAKVRAMLRNGGPGVLRLARNGARLASRRWERPAPPGWWATQLPRLGFVDIRVEALEHEGGLAWGRKAV